MRVSASNIVCSALLLGSAAATPLRARLSSRPCSGWNATTGGRGDAGQYTTGGASVTLPGGGSITTSSGSVATPSGIVTLPGGGNATTSRGSVTVPSGSVTLPGGGSVTASSGIVATSTGSATLSRSATLSGSATASRSATLSASASATPTAGGVIPVGKAIVKCTVPGTIALTFDDGPSDYTIKALNLLKEAGMRATFFLNGDNYSKIENRVPEVTRMLAEGHQVGSHTWNHPHLSKLSDAEVRSQMYRLEEALYKIIGKIPTYMRPPYFDFNDNTLAALGSIGYHVVNADIDTSDWQFNTKDNYQTAVKNFQTGLDNNGSITLMHDVHFGTIEYILPEIIKIVKASGLKAVPVGECLGASSSEWYRGPRPSGEVTIVPLPTTAAPTATASATATGSARPQPTGVIGPGGACGGTNNYVCETGNCCSQYGFCGSTSEYCGAGCQPLFGLCN